MLPLLRPDRLSSLSDLIEMLTLKLILCVFATVAIFAVPLFIPAGTFAWWRAWVFLGVVFIASALTMFLIFPGHEDLLNERFKFPFQKTQPLGDKIITALLITAFLGSTAFIPLDVFRFHLLGRPGTAVSWFGLVLFIAGWTLISLSFKENAFAAPVIKHQAERQQLVVDTGIYSVIRHPMYAGAIPVLVGMGLWLESYAAALLAIVPITILVARILVEENFLRRELTGYDLYTQRVRHRLLPFIW